MSKIKQRNIINVLLLNMQFEMCCIMSLDNVRAKYLVKIMIALLCQETSFFFEFNDLGFFMPLFESPPL